MIEDFSLTNGVDKPHIRGTGLIIEDMICLTVEEGASHRGMWMVSPGVISWRGVTKSCVLVLRLLKRLCCVR